MQDNEPINLTYGQLSDMVNRIEQIPPLYGVGAPTSSTPAFFLGQTYIDQETGKLYFCSGTEEESGDESGAVPSFMWQETGKSYQAGTGLDLNGTQFSVNTNIIAQKSDIKNATLTIQRNGTQIGTFTANASSNSTVNINVPTNNNQLTNGAGYQNSTQVQNAINSAIAGITSFDYQVVQALPASGVKGTIYLVPSDESGSLENTYEEYIWIQEQGQAGHWEQIGSTAVKLNEVSDADWEALFGQTIENVNGVGL